MPRLLCAVVLVLAVVPSASAQLTLNLRDAIILMDPGESRILSGVVLNLTNQDVDGHLHVDFPAGFTVGGALSQMPAWDCSVSGTSMDCRKSLVPGPSGWQFQIAFAAPSSSRGGIFKVTAVATSAGDTLGTAVDAGVYVTQEFFVRSTDDSGPDSFRAAIEDANAHCTGQPQCKILFALSSSAGLPRIEPLSPLPVITASNLAIAPTPFGFEDRPVVELNGRNLTSGDGLVLQASYPSVTNLVITGFPGNGIAVVDPASYTVYAIASNYIGVDATGEHVDGNGLRGIAVTAPNATVAIGRNVIGGNKRSGIALWAVNRAGLNANRIGISPSGRVISNGASGVYISRGAVNTSVTAGVIAFNLGAGVSIDRGVRNAAVYEISMGENIQADLDWGLDGQNPVRDDEDDRGPNPPVLLSATYIASTNTTEVRGELRGRTVNYGTIAHVLIYAADHVRSSGVTPMTNLSERQVFVRTYDDPAVVTPFTLSLDGDYRGLFISAQTLTQDFPDLSPTAGSELSQAIRVP